MIQGGSGNILQMNANSSAGQIFTNGSLLLRSDGNFIDLELNGGSPVASIVTAGLTLASGKVFAVNTAVGITQDIVVCTGAACASSCTLHITGGIITSATGTCP